MRTVARLSAVVCLLASGAGCSRLPFLHEPAESRDVAFTIQYHFTAPGTTRHVRLMALVPQSLPGRQTIRDVAFSPQPLRLFEGAGNRYAEFFFTDPPREFDVRITGHAHVERYDLSLARPRHGAGRRPDLRAYLLDEPLLPKNDPAIAQAASGFRGLAPLDTVRAIYGFVVGHISYGGPDLSNSNGGASQALADGKGDCTDYADLMVALCRAAGIPARHVLGLYADPATDIHQHSWVEVYLDGLGWVPFDPTVDDCSDNATFDRLGPNYIVFSTVRNDEMLDNYLSYGMYRWWGDKVELKDTYDVLPVEPQSP